MGKQLDGRPEEARVYLNALDQLEMKLAHVDAMLHMTYGAGFESFNELNNEIRENYLWGCSQIVAECRAVVTTIRT